MKSTYIIVQMEDKDEFEEEINKLINDEQFSPLGGVSVHYDTESCCDVFTQALFYKEESSN